MKHRIIFSLLTTEIIDNTREENKYCFNWNNLIYNKETDYEII